MVEVFEFFDLASVCNRCDALREELRKHNYLPILFDFEKPRSRDTDETITLLARMARFIVADISDAKSVLQEKLGLSEPDAFRWIQKTAMDLRLSMKQVSDGVVEHGVAGLGADDRGPTDAS